MPRVALRTQELHQRVLDSFGEHLKWHSDPAHKPLEIDLVPPLPPRIRAYVYNATTPPGGRTIGECKVQLIIPGQRPGRRADFDRSGGRSVLLLGYNADYDAFLLWDAGLHFDFPYSKNVQAKSETLVAACAGRIVEQPRMLRPGGGSQVTEYVIAGRSDVLPSLVARRTELTRKRLASRE